MSQESVRQKEDSVYTMVYDQFREKRGNGPIPLDALVEFITTNKLLQDDAAHAWRNELRRRIARWANRRCYRDKQDRKVRCMHAAKYPVYKKGQLTFETLWDDHATMSVEHAMKSFTQREEQIEGSKRRLINDVDSFNENNPNAVGHEIQLRLHYEPVDTIEPQEVEIIPTSETTVITNPRPR